MTGTRTVASLALLALSAWAVSSACGTGQRSGQGNATPGVQAAAGGIQNRAQPERGADADDPGAASAEATPAGWGSTVSVTISDRPQPRPIDLLVSLSLPAPAKNLAALRSYADAVMPGLGAGLPIGSAEQFLTFLTGGGLAGLDQNKPIRALLASPRDYPDSWLLIGTAASGGEGAASDDSRVVFRHGGLVAVGAPSVVELLAPYAFTTLSAEPMPAELTAIVHIDAVRVYLQEQIKIMLSATAASAQRDPRGAALATAVRAVMKLVAESDRLALSLSAQGTSASASCALIPKADSAFAAVVAGETPAQFSLLGELPRAPVAIAGHSNSQALSDVMHKLTENQSSRFLDAALRAKAERADKEFRAAVTGEYAAALTLSKARGGLFSSVWQTADTAAAATALDTLMGGVWGEMAKRHAPTMAPKKRTFKHRRATLTEYVFPLPKDTPANIRAGIEAFAGKGGVALITGGAGQRVIATVGKDARKHAGQLVDTALGKGAGAHLDPALAGILGDARKRKESLVLAVDVQSVLADLGIGQAPAGGGDWAVVGLGFADQSVAVRATVPAGAARILAQLLMAP